MAFPTIADADTKNGVVASNATGWTLTWPTNLAAGDLVLAFLAIDGSVTTNMASTGWVESTNTAGGAVTQTAAKRVATGSESGTFSVTISASESGGWRVFRIPAASWSGALGTVFANGATGGGIVGAGTSDTTATPNVTALNPANWDIEDTLWIVAIAIDTSRTISVYPYADRNTADNSGGSGGATLGICTTTSAAASLDPGAFTISNADESSVRLYAIRPAASGPTTHEAAAAITANGTITAAGATLDAARIPNNRRNRMPDLVAH